MDYKRSEDTILEAVARLTGDIQGADDATLNRLRSLSAEALRAGPVDEVPSVLARAIDLDVDEEMRAAARSDPLEPDELGAPVRIVRRDAREDLLSARFAGPLSGLGGAERVGPFRVDGRHIWFDVYRATRRFTVSETGTAAPALVMTKARRPLVEVVGQVTLDLQPGTVWIRGDLLDGSLPAGAYVGVNVRDGKLTLPNPVSVGEDAIEVNGPLKSTLELQLQGQVVAPSEDGCRSGAKVVLPELTFKFGPGGLVIEGTAGKAAAWGQDFEFSQPTGSLDFIAALWTLVVGYEVAPDVFDGGAIKSELAGFDGEVQISHAGLGLPVVVGAPSILGPASTAPSWWLAVKELQARWYVPDRRYHSIDAWVGISDRSALLFAPSVSPLTVRITHVYRLWEIADGDGRRVPWRQTYAHPFAFLYRCDVVDGEDLLVTGSAKVVLDRPVQINGIPVRTPTTLGVVHLKKGAGPVHATLAALVGDADDNRLALRNALVWATRAAALFATGKLTDREFIDAGSAQVFFGVYTWAPTLPDPYVGSFSIHRPNIAQPRTLILARIGWTAPAKVQVSFEGRLGPPVVTGKRASPGHPVPAPTTEVAPDVGMTQAQQDSRTHDDEGRARWDAARGMEEEVQGARAKIADEKNQNAQETIDGYVGKLLGPTPPVILLDVSTNQDLLGVAMWGWMGRESRARSASFVAGGMPAVGGGLLDFPVRRLEVMSPVEALRVVTLPQVQWEPVRTLDADQDIVTLGWFPTPLASATDGGATVLGARSQRLVPTIPEDALDGTIVAFDEGQEVVFRTTLPFGLISAVQLLPHDQGDRRADLYQLVRPEFPEEDARGGLHIAAWAEGGRPDDGGISPTFEGHMRQLINGVDLSTGTPLGLSVLGSTGAPGGSVETVFNNDMTQNPRVPVTRFDLSGYGGSNFSEWHNPFAAYAEASKVQFQVMIGRTALEIIKVTSVLHPWGIRVTRAITIERRSGGGIIRRDSGWQATTPGLLDYRYFNTGTNKIDVPDYLFDAGLFRGLFNVRSIRPAPGVDFAHPGGTFVPYYFDAQLALDGPSGRVQALGVLGWLQTKPSGDPADKEALRSLIQAQGPVGGPIDVWMEFGGSGLPFRARRIEVGLADDGGKPVFVATVRGVPKLPKTGAWSVVRRPVATVPPGGGEAVPISETRGVPLIRRYPIAYPKEDTSVFTSLPLSGATGDYRFADAEDLLTPAAPQNEYCLLQSTPTHAFIFPRPYALASGPKRIRSDEGPALADVIARSTSKGAFPPPQNAIQLGATYHFNVGQDGSLALSHPVTINNHPTPLRLSGSSGHGAEMLYEEATLTLHLNADNWSADFLGLRIWSDIAGMRRVSGADLNIVGSTQQRPQVAEMRVLLEETIEDILTYIPLVGDRGRQGPIDLGASNAKHELKVEIAEIVDIPKHGWDVGGAKLKLKLGSVQSLGFDKATGSPKASGKLIAGFAGEIPLTSIVVASVYLVIKLDIGFTIASVAGSVTTEKFDLLAFVGIGVKGSIGPFTAYAFLGVGFVLSYDLVANLPKYGGLVRFEAGVDIFVVTVKLRADLQGLIYDDGGTTKCDYSGKVKLQVDIFLIISISATYSITETTEF